VFKTPVFSKNTSYKRSKRSFLMFFFTILLTKVVKLAQKNHMKHLTTLLMLLFCMHSFSQTLKPSATLEEEPIYETVDKVAYYMAGYEKFYESIQDNMICQREKIKKKNLEILLRFIVERDGTVSNPEILKSDLSACNASVLQAVKGTKGWIPGKINGRVVRSYVTLPIHLQKAK